MAPRIWPCELCGGKTLYIEPFVNLWDYYSAGLIGETSLQVLTGKSQDICLLDRQILKPHCQCPHPYA